MKWLKSILLSVLGLLLLWLALRNLPLQQLGAQLKQANYWLIIPVFVVTLLGYIVRIKRWQLLYNNLQFKVPFKTMWVALCAGYLVSYVVPRGGEITRCLIVKRYNNVPFTQSIASVIVERLTDTFCLLFLIVSILVFNVHQTSSFFMDNIIQPITNTLHFNGILFVVILGIAALVGGYFLINKKVSNSTWVNQFIDALKSMVLLKQKWFYFLFTSLIWVGYFLMTYIWIFAFDESHSLNAQQVFVVMIIGTIGKSVPIQGGGMGAYHYLVAQAFLLFGVSLVVGNALAIIIHGTQTLFTLITGSTAYLMLMYDEKGRNL
ncbi:MAG: flippase-like domain-containing protein [Bacteroidia bacterium]|nr:flippase-like domain-containing protein [Bacteroidia bacterium]